MKEKTEENERKTKFVNYKLKYFKKSIDKCVFL